MNFPGYRVIEELGTGALSTVYTAEQLSLGRHVAIKSLRPTIAPSSPFAAQLEREAQVLRELAHPGIVLLFDFVKTAESMYLVLEHVEGHSLAELVARKVRLPPEVAAAIGASVARALAHAHERGVVHRDVKPANVLLSKRGEVKIVDFSIAYRGRLPSADQPLARTDDATFGTPAYMSPEQILGEQVDARSDVFSLGVVLYQLVAGHRPFEREDDKDRRAAAQRIRRDPPIPLRTRVPHVPRPFERAVMRALEKLPADRFPSSADMAEALEQFVRSVTHEDEPKLARRALALGGFLPLEAEDGSKAPITQPKRKPMFGMLAGFAAVFAALVASGVYLQLGSGAAFGSRPGDQPLELLPKNGGGLRVLASPWAHVAVDGQPVDTTPFARPIPLAPGRHHVTLSHPDAPDERRVIDVAPGEVVLLDVLMKIPTEDALETAATDASPAGGQPGPREGSSALSPGEGAKGRAGERKRER